MPKEAWVITSTSNSALREFVYGQTPPGWREASSPPSLSPGEWYVVDDFVFRVRSQNGGFTGEVCRLSELLEQFDTGQSPGCRAER